MSSPKKSLGQNFLTSVGAINKMVETALSCQGPTSTVLEVGPGRGVLTEALLKKFDKVLAVEKDELLAEKLKERFAKEVADGRLQIVTGDILTLTPVDLKLGNYAIVANIPYYITGHFLKIWLSTQAQPKYMVLMVQKEVAKRIVAHSTNSSWPGRDSKESLLSISVKTYGEPTYIETIKKGSFFPIPKVDSAILKIDNISKTFFSNLESPPETSLGAELPKNPKKFLEKQFPNHPRDSVGQEERFFTLVRAGFAHKRKLLLSNLSSGGFNPSLNKDIFGLCGIDLKVRAEDMTIEKWKCLYFEMIVCQQPFYSSP